MTPGEWEAAVGGELDRAKTADQYRQRRVLRVVDATHVELDGRTHVNFSSNNYLGLTHHPRLIEAVREAAAADGAGSGAAGLITGYGPRHASAEQSVARWKGVEAALLLPSGYQANHAAVQTLATTAAPCGGARFLLDKLVHASLIDAVRASGAPFRVFPHNGLGKLRRLLSEADPKQLQVVMTESIFSMDGDAADLRGLAEIKEELPFVLLLDEAHASGVYGHRGAGYAAECGLQNAVDISIVTLSKAFGCVGGAICGSRTFCDAVVNFGRAYIYSTSVPSMIPAAAEAAIQVLSEEPWRQQRVRELAKRVRGRLKRESFEVSGEVSPIIPVIVGSEEAALKASASLKGRGLLVLAVRPPTVPRGKSRLRVTVSAAHDDDEVERLIDAIEGLKLARG